MYNSNAELMEKFFRISRLLHQSHHHNDGHCSASCRGRGRVLSLLRTYPEISQKELSSLLDIRSQSLGELLARLERDGCILRTASEEDRRAMNVKLTAKGEAAADRAQQNKEKAAALFDCLDAHEKRILSDLIDRLTTEFKKAAGETANLNP